MTASAPHPYTAWRAEAAARDRDYAAAYQAGYEAHRTEHRRLWVFGVLAAVFLFARRLPALGFLAIALWAVLVVVALWPLVFVGVAIELTLRQHRRWRSWWRTVGYVLTWPGYLALGYLALVERSAWPLVGIAVLAVAWLIEDRLREHRSLRPDPARTSPEPFPPDASYKFCHVGMAKICSMRRDRCSE